MWVLVPPLLSLDLTTGSSQSKIKHKLIIRISLVQPGLGRRTLTYLLNILFTYWTVNKLFTPWPTSCWWTAKSQTWQDTKWWWSSSCLAIRVKVCIDVESVTSGLTKAKLRNIPSVIFSKSWWSDSFSVSFYLINKPQTPSGNYDLRSWNLHRFSIYVWTVLIILR